VPVQCLFRSPMYRPLRAQQGGAGICDPQNVFSVNQKIKPAA
jgi:hypothetical protein